MQKIFKIYKGLQRPLVFKMFKGKYIYWAAGSMVSGIISGGIASSIFSSVVGISVMLGVTIPSLLYTIERQRKGMYAKKKETLIFIIKPSYKFRK